MKRLTILLLIAFTFFSCGPEEEEAELIGQFDQVDMGKVRWDPNRFPLKMSYSDNHQEGTGLLINEVMDNWEQGNNIDFFDSPNVTSTKNFSKLEDYFNKDRDVLGIYLVNVPINDLLSDYLAVAQIFIQRSTDDIGNPYYQIIHGDIIINGAGYTFSNDPDDFTTYYYKSLITHELGHILGVPHFESGIMASSMSTKDFNTELTQQEYDYLYEKYQRAPTSSSSKLFHQVSPDTYRAIFYLKAK